MRAVVLRSFGPPDVLRVEEVPTPEPGPGDVLIQGGYPGHALLVLDVAEAAGKSYLLLGQSYMPAQQFHVVNNLLDPKLSPWFDGTALDLGGVQTPEWRPFRRVDARRFPATSGSAGRSSESR